MDTSLANDPQFIKNYTKHCKHLKRTVLVCWPAVPTTKKLRWTQPACHVDTFVDPLR